VASGYLLWWLVGIFSGGLWVSSLAACGYLLWRLVGIFSGG
jgi:hypothetical protein